MLRFFNHREKLAKKRHNSNSRALSMELEVGVASFEFTNIVLVVLSFYFGQIQSDSFKSQNDHNLSSILIWNCLGSQLDL